MPAHDTIALRRCVLAASVLDDVDVTPSDAGLLLSGWESALVKWADVAAALGPFAPESSVGRRRVSGWLRLRAAALDGAAGWGPAARLVALPLDHAAHPGEGWAQEHLLGGALDLGLGVIGVLGDPDAVAALPPGVIAGTPAQPQAAQWWAAARAHAEAMGQLAAARLRRDGPIDAVIKPVGGCDVMALLASSALRAHLAAGDDSGLCALAVPMRTRGWFDVRRIDPAYVMAAWSATDDFDRGFPRPLLVTASEVVATREGGDPVRHALSP